MSKKLLFKGGHATGMIPYEIEDFSTLYMRDARVDEKTKAYIDSVIGNSVLNLCPYRNVLVTHKYDTVEGNIVTLDDCEDDEIIQLSEIQGNTMVNCNKDTDKELILMPNLETNGYSNITLTEGIDGGKVDVSLEGNTMVNVCDQEEAVAITKSYTVETGNHIALQGEYDGKCRPNVYGNTMVNLALAKDDYSYKNDIVTNNRINLVHNLKAGVTYTLIRTISEFSGGLIQEAINFYDMSFYTDGKQAQDHNCQYRGNGQYVSKFTPTKDVTHMDIIIGMDNIDKTNGIYPTITISDYMILEGDYTNKPIPDYFTGMKSSFEDKLVPENLAEFRQFEGCFRDCVSIENDIITITNPATNGAVEYNIKGVKPNTTYTFYFNVLEHTEGVYFNFDLYPDSYEELGSFGNVGENRIVYTMPNDVSTLESFRIYIPSGNTTTTKITKPIIVEGDYTKYDFTDYDSTKGGKYKVDYKVTGKNKYDDTKFVNNSTIDNSGTLVNSEGWIISDYFSISPNTNYTLSYTSDVTSYYQFKVVWYDNKLNFINMDYVKENGTYSHTYLSPNNAKYCRISYSVIVSNKPAVRKNIQLEEGTTATDYEPYKESIKTLYLNSPLLEGDTIEQSGNDIIHVHRYGKVVLDGTNYVPIREQILTTSDSYRWTFVIPNIKNSINSTTGLGICDKYPIVSPDDTWMSVEGITQNNNDNEIVLYLDKYKDGSDASKQALINELSTSPITFIYKKSTPTQEIISSNDNLLLDSYTNGHLDVDSVVPIDKVVFQGNFNKSLRYLYPNTEYIIQFESNNSGKIDKLHLAGTNSDIFNVVKGVNKYTLTTGELSSKSIVINGIGFNMSKVVVTPKVDNDFGYFKGMKSVGQNDVDGHKIEILSRNKNLFYGDIEMGFINDINGKEMGWNEYFRCKEYIPCKPDTRYISTFKYSDELKYCYLLCYDKNKEFISGIKSWELSKQKTPIGCAYIRIAGQCINSGVVVLSNISEILINEDTATDYIPHAENKKEILLNEPLRGLPNGVKDKYVIIDGKWYIERNCGYSNVIIDKKSVGNNGLSYRYSYIHNGNSASISSSIASKTMFVDNMYGAKNVAVADYSSTKDKNTLYFHFANMDNVPSYAQDLASFREFIDGKVINIVFLLNTPTYEPIDYNPFEVYTDTTHISNNSNIPCNMVIRNSGFNCMLKPNTTYTVSSNNGLSSVTTKSSIGDGILRFYDKDTTSVTKMSKVLVLEGDYITGNPPIPAFFKGMESAFEQQLVTDEKDEHYGKYKVNVKAVGKNLLDESKGVINSSLGNSKTICIKVKPNTTYVYSSSVYKGAIAIYQLPFIVGNNTIVQELDNMGYNSSAISDSKSFTTSGSTNYIFMNYDRASNVQIEQGTKATEYEPYKENNITFYLKEPLRGVGDIKDKVYVKEDKIVVERNCVSYVLDSNKIPDLTSCGNKLYMCNILVNNSMVNTGYGEVVCNSFPCDIYNAHRRNYANTISTVVDASVPNGVIRIITDKDTKTLKQWLQQNPVKVVYQLATPTYEEVECDLSKLALEGYNHGTLFYDTNIPVTTQFYDFNVNIKDMLIPNETYYVTFNADRVKDITINLSGVQVNYKTSMGYNKVPIQLGDVVNTNFSMDSRGVELSDLMVSTSTSLIYVKDMNDVCVYDEATNKYSITITSTDGKETDKRVILLDYPLLRLNKDVYDRLYYSNKDSRYRIDKKVFKHKFTNEHEYSKYAAETNDTYYSSFISLNEAIKDYVVITNEKVKTVKVEDDKYYFKIKWSDLGVSDKTEANGNQGVKDFFNNNEVYLYYATDGFVEIVDGLRRQTLKVYQPETFMKFSGNTTTTVTILIPMKNV